MAGGVVLTCALHKIGIVIKKKGTIIEELLLNIKKRFTTK